MHSSWKLLFDKYNIDLTDLYKYQVYPPQNLVFRVFEMDVQEIKIVLLGQYPYHGLNQANGLSFSVQNEIKIPPSLKNIFNFQNGIINFHTVI